MSEFANILDALYRNFLLRDIFSKIVPGAIIVWAVFFNSHVVQSITDYKVGGLGWPTVIFIAGIAWIVGFAVQEIGEFLGLIHQYPRTQIQYPKSPIVQENYLDASGRYELRVAFWQIAAPIEIQQAERFAIIKEVCGNGAIAISIGSIVMAFHLIESGNIAFLSFIIWIGLFLLSFLLLRANRTHAYKQYRFMEYVKNKHQCEGAANDSSNHSELDGCPCSTCVPATLWRKASRQPISIL